MSSWQTSAVLRGARARRRLAPLGALAALACALLVASPAAAQPAPDATPPATAPPPAGPAAAAPAPTSSAVPALGAPSPVASALAAAAPGAVVPPAPGPVLDAVRAACRDADVVDVFAFVTGGALLATGVTLAVVALTTPVAQRNLGHAFMLGVGPGLGLGGIGVPFGRGVIREENPLSSACSHVRRSPPSALDARDVDITARLLRHNGQPTSVVLALLLTAATVAVGSFAAVAIALNSFELTQLSGGLSAAVIAGWFIFPPTPPRVAGQRFAAGFYGPTGLPPLRRAAVQARPVFSGLGLGVVGSF